MRVLMTADCVGGVWSHALDLIHALDAADVQVSLAVMGGPLAEDQRRQAREAPLVGCHESLEPLEWMPEPWEGLHRAGRWLEGIAEELRPDVVHLNGYVHAALSWPAPVLVAGHSCVVSWWSAVRGAEAPSGWDRYRREVGHGLACADAVVAPTRWMLDQLELGYGRIEGARVISNGIVLGPADRARRQPFVLAAGRRWDEAKNLRLLESAARGLPWPTLVAGEGGAGGESRDRGVRLLGRLPREEVRRRMAQASIFAAPARYEPFGLAALEAAAAGCALVLGDIPSLREVWEDAARYVDPDDVGALHRALRDLIEDPPALRLLAARARARAGTYSAHRMARSYRQLYARMCADRNTATVAALRGVGP